MLTQSTIVVPSASRASGAKPLLTLTQFPKGVEAHLAVPASQLPQYERHLRNHGGAFHCNVELLPVPDGVVGISQTRQWLTDWCPTPVLLQFSDDLWLYVRDPARGYTAGVAKLRDATLAEVATILKWLEEVTTVEGYTHAGISQRAGNQRHPDPEKVGGTRMCDIYAHNVDTLRVEGVRWDRVPLMEDFDVTLQLLRAGHPQIVSYDFAWGQAASNAPGGCSVYRDGAMQAEAARRLAELHPGYVTVVQKKAESWAGGLAERYDVRVQWAKALEEGQRQIENEMHGRAQ